MHQLQLFGSTEPPAPPWSRLMAALWALAPTTPIPISEARALAAAQALATGRLRGHSPQRIFSLWERFDGFARRSRDVTLVSAVDADVVDAFVASRVVGGAIPSASTQHLRRAAVRLLFKLLREMRLVEGDPTLDVRVPARSDRDVRPLTDTEVEAGRWAALATTVVTRHPAVWALAEAGAWPSELGEVRVSDVDLSHETVLLPGGPKVAPRRVPLTDWGVSQLARRSRSLRGGRVAYDGEGTDESRRASTTEALRLTLQRAGLWGPRVAVVSVTAWAGVRARQEAGQIEDAARRLGLSSLDRAAQAIGYDWTAER